MYTLPNMFTVANLICGCIAMYGVFYESAWVMIVAFILALVFDFLDGWSARMLGQTSPFGMELDSLADLVSFGVLPTFLLIDIVERTIEISDWPVYGLLFLLAAGAAIRLARFNAVEKEDEGFNGMPSPAMAMMTFAIWINLDNAHYPSLEMLADPSFILIVALGLILLMNLPLRFIKFSIGKSFTLHQTLSVILILVFVGGLFVSWRLSVLITVITYLILSLLLPLFTNVAQHE